MDNLTTRTIEVTPIKLFDHKASYTKYQVWREDERTRQEQAYKNQQKYIEDTEVLINKFRAKKNKAAFAQSLIKKLEKLDRIEVDAADKAEIRFRFPPAPRSGKVSIEAKGLSKSFDDLHVFKELDFIYPVSEGRFGRKERRGKDDTHPHLHGLETSGGELTIKYNVDIGYYAQNQAEELDGELTVFETLDEVAGRNQSACAPSSDHSRSLVKTSTKKSRSSPGGKARLALCKLLPTPTIPDP